MDFAGGLSGSDCSVHLTVLKRYRADFELVLTGFEDPKTERWYLCFDLVLLASMAKSPTTICGSLIMSQTIFPVHNSTTALLLDFVCSLASEIGPRMAPLVQVMDVSLSICIIALVHFDFT